MPDLFCFPRFAFLWLKRIGYEAHCLSAQLISSTRAIPHTGKLPVVFLNGFESDHAGSSFLKAFGIADQVLQSSERVSFSIAAHFLGPLSSKS